MNHASRSQELTVRMVRAASVTESEGEQAFPDVLLAMLRELPYFQAHPQAIWEETIKSDPLGRRNIYALVRGEGPATVILTGHYDVVDVRNYGPHVGSAFDPDTLLQHLIDDLELNARSEAEHRALQDLKSGDFLPGRGALDMKSGLAAGLVTLERFAQMNRKWGNVLFVAVADEEVSSHGARFAAPSLTALARREGLDIRGVINLDATGDNGDGHQGQAVYLGTVGKLLVSAFVVGVDTHAGYALDGVNVNFLCSRLASSFELNPALTDTSHGMVGTPPTILKQQDLKTHYDVTTPARAWLCVNVLTHGWDAAQVLQKFRDVAQEALGEALTLLRERAEALGERASAAHGVEPLVMTHAELRAAAQAARPDLEGELRSFEATLPATLDYPTRSARLTSWLWDASGLLGPAVVLGFASLHYPNTRLDETLPADTRFLHTVRNTLAQAPERHGVNVMERPVFTGISDMSWFGRSDASDLKSVNDNTPIREAHLHAPPAGWPCVNLGPWGRDYHQWLERVHAPYSFGVLPELVWEITQATLEDGNSY